MDSWTRTRVTHMLGLRYPIVQGPMGGGLSTPALVAAVSNTGGLGSLGAYHLPPAEIDATVAAIRGLTDRPFAVNLWVPRETGAMGGLTSTQVHAARSAVAPLRRALGLPGDATVSAVTRPSFERQAEAVLRLAPAVFSFVFGVPPAGVLEECRRRRIHTIGTATTVDEAEALDDAGVDVICASGFEAGGHRGAFLAPVEHSLVGTMALVPQVVDAVRVPVIAAGGIADGRGVAAALALGADAVQLGTAFLACEESGASPLHRAALADRARSRHTTLSRGASGRHARMLRNTFTESLGVNESAVLPFPLQGPFIRDVQTAATAAGHGDLLALYAGQAAPLVGAPRAAALVNALAAGAAHVLGGPGRAGRRSTGLTRA